MARIRGVLFDVDPFLKMQKLVQSVAKFKGLKMTDRSTSFSLYYDSKDANSPLQRHEMNLSELGDALKGMNDMLVTANQLINGKDERITVRVKAGFEKGSFIIPIEVIQSMTSVDILKVIGLTAASGFFTAGSALEVIRKLRARKIDVIESVGSDQVTVKVDGEIIQCDKLAKKLVENKKFRESVSQVFKRPVTKGGIDQVGFRYFSDDTDQNLGEIDQAEPDTVRKVTLESQEALSMDVPDEIYEKNVDTRLDETRIKFLSAHADRTDKWRVTHHGKTLKVEITDDAFLARVRHEDGSFNFGREFTVTMKTTISRRQGSQRDSKMYEIVRVHHESLT